MNLPPNIQAAMDRKPVYANLDHCSQNARPKPEPVVCHESLAAQQTEGPDSARDGRIKVQVVSYRRRLLDEDNLCPKYAIDALRYANLLPDDCPEKVTIQTSQKKVASVADERTEIILTLEQPIATVREMENK